MESVRLGDSSLKVSRVGLSAARLPASGAKAVLEAASAAGIHYLDAGLGGADGALKAHLAGRARGVLGADVDAGGDSQAGRQAVIGQVESRLRSLGVETLDLLWVRGLSSCPLEETLRAVEDCARSGKIHYAGLAGDFPAWLAAESRALQIGEGWDGWIAAKTSSPLAEDLAGFCLSRGLGLVAEDGLDAPAALAQTLADRRLASALAAPRTAAEAKACAGAPKLGVRR